MARGVKTGGRKKGSLNKATASAKEAVSLAFEGIGGVERLKTWAEDNLTEFFKLYGRLIPVESQISGKDGTPLVVPVINVSISDDRPDSAHGAGSGG